MRKSKHVQWSRVTGVAVFEWKEERFGLLADKVDKNTIDAEMEAALQGLQAGEERRGGNASQAVDCCLETMVEQVLAVGRIRQGLRSMHCAKCSSEYSRSPSLRANARKRRRKNR